MTNGIELRPHEIVILTRLDAFPRCDPTARAVTEFKRMRPHYAVFRTPGPKSVDTIVDAADTSVRATEGREGRDCPLRDNWSKSH
jgi:hypothetical protein